jgi:hypothetical protein
VQEASWEAAQQKVVAMQSALDRRRGQLQATEAQLAALREDHRSSQRALSQLTTQLKQACGHRSGDERSEPARLVEQLEAQRNAALSAAQEADVMAAARQVCSCKCVGLLVPHAQVSAHFCDQAVSLTWRQC